MQIEFLDINKLKPYKLNSKKHPISQIEGLRNSINRFGFTQPVVVDQNDEIIIGHGRVEAAKLVGLKQIPCVKRSDLTANEIKALRLIDNRIAETGWDSNLLDLDLTEIEFDFAPFNISFDDLIESKIQEGLTDPDDVPPAPEIPKSKLGDIYQLGKHRLICGDSTDKNTVLKLLGGVVPSLMVTDPPYGVNYDPNWRNEVDRANGKPFGARATGKVENDDSPDWTEAWMLFGGDVAYVWHAGIYANAVADSLIDAGFNIRSQIIWAKSRFAISRGDYHWQHEPCWYVVRKGGKGHWSGDRSQSTLWAINHSKSDTGHGTQKPVECMRRPIENNSNVGQVVYDPFLGSGTTLIAAEQSGRICYGVELNPIYCDVIIKRWEDFTGEKASCATN